ncbi:MAG TPA: formate dehydrogenase accessory sulfurtransferase FdhD, partial [Polyangia bacterium]
MSTHSLPIWSQAGARIVERPVDRRGAPTAAAARAADRDLVVAEEPLEIRIGGESLIVTMRTPGDDLDLAAGLLFTEGVIASMADVAALAHG